MTKAQLNLKDPFPPQGIEAESQAFVTCYHIYAPQRRSSSIFKRLRMASGLHFTRQARHQRV